MAIIHESPAPDNSAEPGDALPVTAGSAGEWLPLTAADAGDDECFPRNTELRLALALEAEQEKPSRVKRTRRPTLAATLKQARAAGRSVKGAEVHADHLTLTFGEPDASTTNSNPWDEIYDANAKRPS